MVPNKLLNPLETNAFKKICLEGYSAEELARKEGVSRQSINQAKQRAISKLQLFFMEEDKAI